MATENLDSSAVRIHLNELKAEFDKAMREGEEFVRVQMMYSTIKELEWHLKVLDWEKTPHADRSSPYSEGRPYL